MKNFPHQFSDLAKLTGALAVARDVIGNGTDMADDGTYGEALARAGVYAFRSEEGDDVEALLALERQKPASNQGTRTAAREMRRFLALTGFIGQPAGAWQLSTRGQELLADGGGQVRAALWREAMLAMTVSDAAGNVSHPYRVLLRLVADYPGIETRKLMLALEARDDSAAEYARVSLLAASSFEDAMEATGTTPANARNAVKILPAIAQQVGDLRRGTDKRTYPEVQAVVAEDGIEQAPPAQTAKAPTAPKQAKAVTAATIAAVPKFKPPVPVTVDLTGAIALQKRRTEQHQALVRAFAMHVEGRGFLLSENPFDCLARKEAKALLVEGKTLDGSPVDERRQGEKALGQIRGYAHFDLPAGVNEADLHLAVLFSQRPTDEMVAFLNKQSLVVVWQDGAGWTASDVHGHLGDFLP